MCSDLIMSLSDSILTNRVAFVCQEHLQMINFAILNVFLWTKAARYWKENIGVTYQDFPTLDTSFVSPCFVAIQSKGILRLIFCLYHEDKFGISKWSIPNVINCKCEHFRVGIMFTLFSNKKYYFCECTCRTYINFMQNNSSIISGIEPPSPPLKQNYLHLQYEYDIISKIMIFNSCENVILLRNLWHSCFTNASLMQFRR